MLSDSEVRRDGVPRSGRIDRTAADALSWIAKIRIAWEEHGGYLLEPGNPAVQIFETCRADEHDSLLHALNTVARQRDPPNS